LKKINLDFKENIISDDQEIVEENEDIQNNVQCLNNISNNMDTFIKSIKERVAVLSDTRDRLVTFYLAYVLLFFGLRKIFLSGQK
jgi:hypothetical protein